MAVMLLRVLDHAAVILPGEVGHVAVMLPVWWTDAAVMIPVVDHAAVMLLCGGPRGGHAPRECLLVRRDTWRSCSSRVVDHMAGHAPR
ncbi:hypothetical protein CYMTET_34471 [Cymbomonas tetramitiformis]|uniref:Uncharacterized protein n=1 Tax=Cymbomonas tetramitiformis TaxID=36881 RepID=A0AAE0FB78_9CHLO|nr:hypothetical protein CYMTET_34471 [Cymbomonas tetramitiformis]